MTPRDIAFFLGGAAVCGLAVAGVAVMRGQAVGPAAPSAEASAPPASSPAPAVSAPAPPDTGASGAETLGGGWDEDTLFVYTEAGPRPCPAACVERLAEGLLDGTLPAADLDLVGQAGEAVGAYLAADRGRRRRLLALAGRLAAEDGDDVYTLMSVARGLPPEMVEALSRRIMANPEPGVRPMGLSMLFGADLPPERQARLIGEVIGREREGELLTMALQFSQSLGRDRLDAATLSTVRNLARYAEEAELRGAALASYASLAGGPEATRLTEEALASEEPRVRMAALYAIASATREAPDPAMTTRARGVLTEIANDEGADPELRMSALGLLAYEFGEEAERGSPEPTWPEAVGPEAVRVDR